jgi:hypothetical protein
VSLLKNIYLSVEVDEKETEGEPGEQLAFELAKELTDLVGVKSVQYRYGAFGRVDKVRSEV